MIQPILPGTLDVAVRAVVNELQVRPKTERSWDESGELDLWHELVSCILGSAVSFEQALAAAERLKAHGLIAPPARLASLADYESRVAEVLSDSSDGLGHRFPYLRARHIRRTIEAIYLRGLSLHDLLREAANPMAVRAQLVSLAVGIGPKQASLFLRNIGVGDLAVLDRHVLRFMIWRGLLPDQVQVNTLGRYENVEGVFVRYAAAMSVSVVHLDLAAWIVVRVLKDEVQS